MSPRWRWFLPGYLWALPVVVLIALPLIAFYRAKSFRWIDGVLTCVASRPLLFNAQGQTYGWISIYSDEGERSKPYMRVHEYCHVAQCFVLGILWPLVYVGMYLVNYARAPSKGWDAAYRAIWFETQAYAREAAFVADGKRRWGSQ